MDTEHLLFGIFVYLAAAVISAPLAMRLGLGSVLGYLLAGVVIGPAVLGVVGTEGASVMHFAEFGVIVMLFLVGLELQPSKLWSLRKSILGLGGLQVLLTTIAISAILNLYGISWRTSLTIGLILSMSSTAIVLQSLSERGIMKTSVGQSCFSVLLFQDIAIIPILAFLPLIALKITAAADIQSEAGARFLGALPPWMDGLVILLAVGIIVFAGRYLMRPIFRFIAGTAARETFVAFALLIVTSITLLMQFVGLSAALGTFLGGVILAESEYRHELEMDLQPFKGLLLAVFFIAVGAGINFNLLGKQPFQLLGLVFGFSILKLIILYVLARLFHMNKTDASRFSFSLAQGGEFAFVLISFATGLGLLTVGQSGFLVAIVALSMALAPVLMIFDEKIIQPLFARAQDKPAADNIEQSGTEIIIAGHGRFGMTVDRIIKVGGLTTAVLDHDAEQVETIRQFGYKVFYGDALRLDLLEAAGAREAKILVIAIDDPEKVTELAALAQKRFPHLQIFARAYDRRHAFTLVNMGLTYIYREVFDSSTKMGEDIIQYLKKDPVEASRIVQIFKEHDEKLLRESAKYQNDRNKLIDLSRTARTEINDVLATDRKERTQETS